MASSNDTAHEEIIVTAYLNLINFLAEVIRARHEGDKTVHATHDCNSVTVLIRVVTSINPSYTNVRQSVLVKVIFSLLLQSGISVNVPQFIFNQFINDLFAEIQSLGIDGAVVNVIAEFHDDSDYSCSDFVLLHYNTVKDDRLIASASYYKMAEYLYGTLSIMTLTTILKDEICKNDRFI